MQQYPPIRTQARPAHSHPLITTLKNDRIAWPHPRLTGNMRYLRTAHRVPRSCVNVARGGMEEAVITSHQVSRHLTPLGPQARHRPANVCGFPWSEGFDCIFRNEGATGSNPVSSTKKPWSGRFLVDSPACPSPGSADSRSTGDPQALALEAPHFMRGAFSLGLTSINSEIGIHGQGQGLERQLQLMGAKVR